MKNPTGWLIAAVVVLILAVRFPIPTLLVALSLLVYWRGGQAGLVLFWFWLLAVMLARRRSTARPTWQ
jgi:hypothetical protein